MMKAVLLSFFVCTSAIRLQRYEGESDGDIYLKDEDIAQLTKLYPDWDEPFTLSQLNPQLALLSPTDYDQSYMTRKAMWDKLKKLHRQTEGRVIVTTKSSFSKAQFVPNLHKSGSVIFVVDDPYHSTDGSTYCKDPSVLDDPRVLAVAAEDPMCKHPKVTAIPIGMESMLFTGKRDKKTFDIFMELKEHPIPYNKRRHKVQSDGQMHVFMAPKSTYRPDRHHMRTEVERDAIDDWYIRHIDMKTSFENHVAQAKLSLCPEGNGMDAHRFYHHYALRTPCIVRKGILSEMHSQFPGTIVVDSWKEVTAANIHKWIKEHEENPPIYDPKLLTSNYWINKFLEPHGIPNFFQ